jgi:hypothetical protein
VQADARHPLHFVTPAQLLAPVGEQRVDGADTRLRLRRLSQPDPIFIMPGA